MTTCTLPSWKVRAFSKQQKKLNQKNVFGFMNASKSNNQLNGRQFNQKKKLNGRQANNDDKKVGLSSKFVCLLCLTHNPTHKKRIFIKKTHKKRT